MNNKISITEVKIYPVRKNQGSDRRLKAYATIVLEGCFIVRDLKIISGSDGKRFVSMPSRRSKFGSFRDVAHPLNSDMRDKIEKAVFEEYEKMPETIDSNSGEESSYDMED